MHNTQRDLRYFWHDIVEHLRRGDESSALKVFLFVANQSRNKGIEEATKQLEASKAALIDEIRTACEQSSSNIAKTIRQQKLRYSPKSVQTEFNEVRTGASRNEEPDWLTKTMTLVVNKTGTLVAAGKDRG